MYESDSTQRVIFGAVLVLLGVVAHYCVEFFVWYHINPVQVYVLGRRPSTLVPSLLLVWPEVIVGTLIVLWNLKGCFYGRRF